MTMHSQQTGRARSAFTLVELLVVLLLLAVVTALAVLFVPKLNEQQRAPRGAVMLQQWLVTAKNLAMRDRAGRGIRLLLTDPKNPTLITDAQYIEQPSDFVVMPGVAGATNPLGGPMPVRRIATSTNTQTIVLEPGATTDADFSGGFATQAQNLWPVQTGDYLEVNGGLPHLITAVGPSDPKNLPTVIDQLTLASPLPAPLVFNVKNNQYGTANYRIIRAPRVSSEEQLQLPNQIAIDIGTNTTFGNLLPVDQMQNPPAIDILFSPTGAVITRGTATDAIYLWVRDTTMALGEGDNTIVAIQVRSGAVLAYPVNNTPGADPYSYAKTGRGPQS